MEQAQSEGSRPASGEGANAPAASPLAASKTARRLEANEVQRAGGTARKLSDEPEREVTRLYAETTTPCPRSRVRLASRSLPCTG